MATKPQSAVDRIRAANGNSYDPTSNPGGLADGGHRQNFVPDLNAVVDVAEWAEDLAQEASEDATTASSGATIATQKALEASQSAASALASKNAAAQSAAGVNLPAISAADAGKVLTVKSDGSGYSPLSLPASPAIAPIVVSSPPDNTTASATQTFVAKLQGYAADTLGFYSDYGFPQASRTLNVYLASSPSVIFKTTTTAGAGNSLSVNLQTLGLSVSTNYLAEIVFTDVLGNTTASAKSRFTTPAMYRPNIGDSYQGGFYTGQVNDGGAVFDLIVAPKSGGETTAVWDNPGSATVSPSATSRTAGPTNSARIASFSSGASAARFCEDLNLNSYSDWHLPATDELKLAQDNLRASVTSVAAFQTGGSEAFGTGGYWSSTEVSASNAYLRNFGAGTGVENSSPKTTSTVVRAFRRVAA